MKILNFFRRKAAPRPELTLAIIDDGISITRTSSPGHSTPLDLAPRTLYHGIIFNPSALVAQLSTYLKSAKLKHPTTLVCLPPAADASAAALPFFVLQYTLVLTKAGLQITQVTAPGKSSNLLRLLRRPGTRSPKLWLIVTLVALGTLGTNIGIKHQEITDHHAALTHQTTICKQINTDYEKQFKETNELKVTLKHLQERHATSQEVLRKVHTPTHVLATLAHHTPPSVWLTAVTLNKKEPIKRQPSARSPASTKATGAKPPSKKLLLSLKGTSKSAAAISRLLKNLGGRTSGLKHAVLVKVNKEKLAKQKGVHKKKSKHMLYHFVIEGGVRAGA